MGRGEASFNEDFQPPTVNFLSFEDLLSRDGFYPKRLRLQILHLRLLSILSIAGIAAAGMTYSKYKVDATGDRLGSGS